MGNSNGGSMPFNLTAMMALLTVAGGVFLISQPLSSSRPPSKPAGPDAVIGNQLLESRLWEDPFAHFSDTDFAEKAGGMENFEMGFRQRSDVLLLPVMLSGGRYAEDQEARVRTRYAVVSALGNRGFAPSDAEHVGVGALAWPSTAEIQDAAIQSKGWADFYSGLQGEKRPAGETGVLRIAYEWYRERTFRSGALGANPYKNVLVVYLNEDLFEDYPRLRLALWKEWLDRNGQIANRIEAVKLIGPTRSSTLRAMVPPGALSTSDRDTNGHPEAVFSEALDRHLGSKEPGRGVGVFSPSASAIDAVLIAQGQPGSSARSALAAELSDRFRAFHAFCATDGELAAAAIDELELRNVSLKAADGTGPHMVLIHEWDTFYGRMMSLAFAAELDRAQRDGSDHRGFIDNNRTNGHWPTNLYRFAYLRGLDGQTADGEPQKDGGGSDASQEPATLKQLEMMVADPNKAEGRAQLDSLSRLGGELEALDHSLRMKGAQGIGAVGVLGSDVYDKLLILQALRARFPNALFFTTDLDARFWHRAEREWSRNLIVLGSYGLTLDPKLQVAVPPFRDGQQAGQFAATLAALGTNQFSLGTAPGGFPVRRFEIGREGAIDLSVANPPWLGAKLHPDRDTGPGPARLVGSNWRWLAVSALAGGLLMILFVRPLRRRLTGEAKDFVLQSLWLRSEDLGDEDGAMFLLARILENPRPDSIGAWLITDLHMGQEQSETESLVRSPVLRIEQLLTYLNGLLQRPAIFPKSVVEESPHISEETKAAYARTQVDQQGFFLLRNTSERVRLNRRVLDEFLDGVTGNVPVEDTGGAYAARGAVRVRRAGLELNRLRTMRIRVFRVALVAAVVLFGAFFVALAHQDASPRGEPFSLVSGASVWPTEVIRLVALALSLTFVAVGYFVLRENMVALSRQFRLPIFERESGNYSMLPTLPPPVLRVYAKDLWNRYQQFGFFGRRSVRTLIRFGLYWLFALGLFKALGQPPLVPGRGEAFFVIDTLILIPSVVAFLFLTFWVMDAVQLCRWLIERLSEAPTHYPGSCREHFRRLLGLDALAVETEGIKDATSKSAAEQNRRDVDEAVHEWIDLHLVMELTAAVGKLIYFPFIVFFLMLVSRSDWWDHWAWPPALKLVFGLNLFLIVCSAVLLHRAGNRARDQGVESLKARIARLEHQTKTRAENDLSKAQQLLNDVQSLKRGVFAPFWENPIVGAILVPSGGTVVLEMASYFLNR